MILKVQDCVLSGKFGSFLPYCYSELEQDGLLGAVDMSDFGPYYNKGRSRAPAAFTASQFSDLNLT